MEPVLSVVFSPRRTFSRIRPYLGDGSTVLIVLQVVQTVMRFGSSLIVTRLLAPADYGAIGVITSISYVLMMVTDMGLRGYITRHPNADADLLNTVWSIRLIRNTVLAAIMFFGAGGLAALYASPQVTGAIRVASALFLLDGIGSMSMMLGERERRVLRISVIKFAGFLLRTVVTIVAAIYLRNYWAVIIAMFAAAFFSVFASYMLVPGPPVRLHINREDALDLWRFGRFAMPASILSIVLTQSDKFIFARYFPLEELGQYMLAATIATPIGTLLGEYVMRVFYPRFAEVSREAPEQTPDIYYAARRQIMLLLAVGIGGLAGGGVLLVRLFYSDAYLGAGFYLMLLCLTPLAKMTTLPATQAMIAFGFIRVSLVSNILRLLWVLIAGPIAYFAYGPFAVIVVLIVKEAVMIPYFWWNLHTRGLLNFREEGYIIGAALLGYGIGFAGDHIATALIQAGLLPSF